MTFAVMLRFGE